MNARAEAQKIWDETRWEDEGADFRAIVEPILRALVAREVEPLKKSLEEIRQMTNTEAFAWRVAEDALASLDKSQKEVKP
jgi:hypothetical protein